VLVAALREGLTMSGRPENAVIIDERYAPDDYAALPDLARALVAGGAAVIVAFGDTATHAAAGATKTIPIIATVGNDPVQSGFAASLGRPGKNITGIAQLSGRELLEKRLEFLKEMAPDLVKIGVMLNPASSAETAMLSELEPAARRLGLSLAGLEIDNGTKLAGAFAALTETGRCGLLVLPSTALSNYMQEITTLAVEHRIPGSFTAAHWAEIGGLTSYGPDFADIFRTMGRYADRVLRGERAGDLPFLQPTRFDLVVNLRTAKAIGVMVPQSILNRADVIIE